MIVSVRDGWIVDGQVPGVNPAVNVIIGATVDEEVGRFVDERSGFGIGTCVRGTPEHTAEVDHSELVGI